MAINITSLSMMQDAIPHTQQTPTRGLCAGLVAAPCSVQRIWKRESREALPSRPKSVSRTMSKR